MAQATGSCHEHWPKPRPGAAEIAQPSIPSPLPGLVAYCVRDRWLAPPANLHDASGVRYARQSSLENGGANHRFVVKIESEPRPGPRKSRDDHSVAPARARCISWSEPVVCTTG